MKYNYITIKLRFIEIKKEEFNRSNKLFNDYKALVKYPIII